MPTHLFEVALVGSGGHGTYKFASPDQKLDHYDVWRARKMRPRRFHHHDIISFTQAPGTPAAGAPGTAQPDPGASKGGSPEEKGKEGDDDGESLQYTAPNGKTYMLNGENEDKCTASCKEQLEGMDAKTEGAGSTTWNVMNGGEQKAIGECMRFCQTEFQIQCFPSDSTVVVREQGRVPLSKVRVGDAILVAHRRAALGSPDDSSDWELHFEPVISWLHYAPDADMDVVEVHHAIGEVRLSPDHMIFSRKAGRGSAEARFAHEIQVGDRVVAPWIDGSLAEPEVKEIRRSRARGAYAPLVASGVLFVDGTAVSCYAVPDDIMSSSTYSSFLKGLRSVTGRESAHEVAHLFFWPLRLLGQSVGQRRVKGSEKAAQHGTDITLPEQHIETIHPLGFFYYVLFKSLTM